MPIQALATRSVRSWWDARIRKPQRQFAACTLSDGNWLLAIAGSLRCRETGTGGFVEGWSKVLPGTRRCNGHRFPVSLFRLMRALSAARIFVHTQSDHFALATAGKTLQRDAPGSQRAIIITLGEVHYQAWGSLLHSVRTGSTGFASTFGTSLFAYLQTSPEAADTFNRGMSDVASMLAYAVLLAYDFSQISSLVDVGGGRGQFLRTILQLHPEMKGTIFDLPSTIEQARQCSQGDPCGGRIAAIGGDFFHSVPEGADAYVLCGVIHDWDDDPAVQILRNCRLAMNQKGRLLLVEVVVPDDDAHCFSKLLDLNMMVMTGGRERTRAEFAALLNTAGYSLSRIIPTLAPQSVLEAFPS